MKLSHLFLISLLGSTFVWAQAEEKQMPAVQETSPERGFRLSKKAVETLELKSAGITTSKTVKIPTSALVYFQDKVGVYRLRDRWYKLIPGTLSEKSQKSSIFQSSDLTAGDQIVTEGVGLLRVADMDAFGGEQQ